MQEISSKKERRSSVGTKLCPMAKFGCNFEVSLDRWSEHVSSRLHQEALIKAIETFGREHDCFNTHHSSRQSKADHREYDELSETVEILTDAASCLHDDNLYMSTELETLSSALLAQQADIHTLKDRKSVV